jgi:hypothetical protein
MSDFQALLKYYKDKLEASDSNDASSLELYGMQCVNGSCATYDFSCVHPATSGKRCTLHVTPTKDRLEYDYPEVNTREKRLGKPRADSRKAPAPAPDGAVIMTGGCRERSRSRTRSRSQTRPRLAGKRKKSATPRTPKKLNSRLVGKRKKSVTPRTPRKF